MLILQYFIKKIYLQLMNLVDQSGIKIKSSPYLPHNFLAEKMVLSCLICNFTAINLVIKHLQIESFYFKNHQEIFKAIISMYKKPQYIDIVTLISFLQENGLLKNIGGVKVLLDLINQIPNIVHLEEYIRLVKDKFLRRELIKLGYKSINSSYLTNVPLNTIIAEFEDQLFKINMNSTPSKVLNNSELIYQIFLKLREKADNPDFPGLPSGFYNLDSLTQGFQKSDLIIIAGRPSIGKTAFSLSVSLNIIKSLKLPILFFSLEMSKEQLVYRLIAMETNISQSQLKNGKLNKADWFKINKVLKILSKLPLFINDSYNLSIQEIRTKLKMFLFEQNQIGLIIIDYLQLMQLTNIKSENRAQELSIITRNLKNLAREFNIPIIALSQLSRNVENRLDKKPVLSDLRESGSIEQDADLVLMLSKNRENLSEVVHSYSTIMDLIIAKQRNGPIGTIQLSFNQKNSKYLNL